MDRENWEGRGVKEAEVPRGSPELSLGADHRRTPGGVVEKAASLSTRKTWVRPLWLALRPHHWPKNLFVLAPLLFSQNFFVPSLVLTAVAASVLFCLLSSSVYLLNDLKDREQDRLHPKKCHRPLATGALAPEVAVVALITLLFLGLTGGLLLNAAFALTLSTYWLINLAYSFALKHYVILDVFTIAVGFVLRVVGGAAAIQVEMSSWLIVCTLMLAVFLGFIKRRYELVLLQGQMANHRRVLEEYSKGFLDMMIGISATSAVMSYTLYTISEETIAKFHTRGLLLTLPFVLYGIFRSLYLVYHRNEGGDTAETVFTDRPMIVNLMLWIATGLVILYL